MLTRYHGADADGGDDGTGDRPGGGTGDAPPPGPRFAIIPAIDLRGGRVVRLRQGDFDRETAYDDDPVRVARRWCDAAPGWLHVVDLDGARSGSPQQLAAIRSVVEEARGAGVPCQVAGGIRDAGAVERALAVGAERVILGTALLGEHAPAASLVHHFGADRICAAIDVRDGQAVGHGWTKGAAGSEALAAVARLLEAGIRTFVVTAIARDGLLGGPDLNLLGQVMGAAHGAEVIASGGVGSLADIGEVRALGCAGAILGRALYDGALSLQDALAAARGPVQARSGRVKP